MQRLPEHPLDFSPKTVENFDDLIVFFAHTTYKLHEAENVRLQIEALSTVVRQNASVLKARLERIGDEAIIPLIESFGFPRAIRGLALLTTKKEIERIVHSNVSAVEGLRKALGKTVKVGYNVN